MDVNCQHSNYAAPMTIEVCVEELGDGAFLGRSCGETKGRLDPADLAPFLPIISSVFGVRTSARLPFNGDKRTVSMGRSLRKSACKMGSGDVIQSARQ